MSTVSNAQSTAASVLANINTREKKADAAASEDMNARFLTLLTTQLKNQDPLNPMVLSIKDASGLEVKQIQLDDVAAGSQNFVWDGTANDGSRAADGVYTLELSATLEGEKVTGRTLEFGPVTSVIRGAAGTDFQVGSLGIFKYDDIKQIL